MLNLIVQPYFRQLLFRIFDPIVLIMIMIGGGLLRWHHLPQGVDWFPVVALCSISIIILNLNGSYDALKGTDFGKWCSRPIVGILLSIAIALMVAYMLKVSDVFSRTVVGTWMIVSPLAVVCGRGVLYRYLMFSHHKGLGLEFTILAGEFSSCINLLDDLNSQPGHALKVVGIAAVGNLEQHGSGIIVDEIKNLPTLVEDSRARRVIVCGAIGYHDVLKNVKELLNRHPVTIEYAPDFGPLLIFSLRVTQRAGRTFLDISANPLSHEAQIIKTIEDKILSLILILLLSPLMIVTALAVKLSSKGPIFYVQKRHGLHGIPIRVLKFRSMYVRDSVPVSGPSDGEQAEAKPITEFHQAKRSDPRITPVGNFIRRTSLDELPQLFNVLKGDMSLVGPRPHAIEHNHQFADTVTGLMTRHYCKPGITGLAQVCGLRGETPNPDAMRERVRLDIEYIRSWSVWLDLKILILTIFRGIITRQP